MKFISRIFCLLALISLVGCQKSETIREVDGGGHSTSGGDTSGTIDGGGGGNGVYGKPLESFHVDLVESADAKTLILPLIQNVAKTFPALAGDMLYILHERAWYFIPVDLGKLSSARIGTYFPTDQIALQNLREVWINSKTYASMTENADKQKILIHEIMMGVRLLSLSTPLDRCLAESEMALLNADEKAAGEGLATKRTSCYDHYKKESVFNSGDLFDAGKKLTDWDYANIRSLTLEITESVGNINGADMQARFKSSGFRTYGE